MALLREWLAAWKSYTAEEEEAIAIDLCEEEERYLQLHNAWLNMVDEIRNENSPLEHCPECGLSRDAGYGDHGCEGCGT